MASRPKTLTAACIPILVGTALADPTRVSWFLSLCALFVAFSIQLATNFMNDALDFVKEVDTSARLGPPRVCQQGLVEPECVMAWGRMCLVIACLFAIPLVYVGGWWICCLLLISLLLAYGYTGGPYPLAAHGLGDLFVLIFFGWVATVSVYFLQTGSVDVRSFVGGTQVGLLATTMIAVNNLRDIDQDRLAKKKTLAVRLGIFFAKIEVIALLFIPYALGGYWVYKGQGVAAWYPFFALPLAAILAAKIWQTAPCREYNVFLAQSGLHHLLFGLLLSFGLWVSS